MIGCKNGCSFCPQLTIISQYKKHGGTPLVPMNINLFKACINKLPQSTDLLFSGMCEPFLNSKCTDMIVYAHERGLNVRVYTTLVGMTLRDVEILKKINFSNDSQSFVVHLPSKGNIERISIAEPFMSVLNEIYLSSIPAVYHFHGDGMEEHVEEFFKNKPAKIEYFPAHSRAGNIKVNIPKRRIGTIGCIKVKLYGSYGHVLLPDGTVVLCCQDYSMKHVLGNLKSQTFDEILHGSELKRVEMGHRVESIDILCRNCEYSYDISLKAKLSNQKFTHPDHHE